MRYQAVAQSMAIKAKGVNTDPELKALVAKQGYDFYEEFKDDGKEYNGDIYSGAYYGLKGLIGAEILAQNPLVGPESANEKGDSILNQYHGHKPLNEFERQVAVRSVSYSQDGKRIFSAGGDGRLLGWNVQTREFEEIYRSEAVDRVVNVSPNDRWLALATNRDEIDLFDLNEPGAEPQRITSHRGAIYDLVFLPDNSGFISVGADREVLKTNLITREVTEIALVSSKVVSLAISPDGKTLAAGSQRGEVFLFHLDESVDNSSQGAIYRKNQEQYPVQDLTFSESGDYIAIGGFNFENGYGYVVIWDMVNKKQYGPELTGFTSRVTHVEFSPGDKLVAASSSDKSARMWDMDPNNIYDLPTVFDDHTDWVWDLDFSPDGKGLMTACADGLIRYFPTKPDGMVNQMCDYLTRNMSDIEWRQFVADVNDIKWEATCSGKPKPVPEEF